jgi:hypothetical protein
LYVDESLEPDESLVDEVSSESSIESNSNEDSASYNERLNAETESEDSEVSRHDPDSDFEHSSIESSSSSSEEEEEEEPVQTRVRSRRRRCKSVPRPRKTESGYNEDDWLAPDNEGNVVSTCSQQYMFHDNGKIPVFERYKRVCQDKSYRHGDEAMEVGRLTVDDLEKEDAKAIKKTYSPALFTFTSENIQVVIDKENLFSEPGPGLLYCNPCKGYRKRGEFSPAMRSLNLQVKTDGIISYCLRHTSSSGFHTTVSDS